MHKNARCNKNLELAVQIGIIIDGELGALSAWTFMASKGVSESTILRVLLSAENRRSSDAVLVEMFKEITDIREHVSANPRFARRK